MSPDRQKLKALRQKVKELNNKAKALREEIVPKPPPVPRLSGRSRKRMRERTAGAPEGQGNARRDVQLADLRAARLKVLLEHWRTQRLYDNTLAQVKRLLRDIERGNAAAKSAAKHFISVEAEEKGNAYPSSSEAGSDDEDDGFIDDDSDSEDEQPRHRSSLNMYMASTRLPPGASLGALQTAQQVPSISLDHQADAVQTFKTTNKKRLKRR
ncbi:hypothetical protein V8E36_007787 [Tilletia maclaganii]